jgi:hypothetical protein
MTRLYRAGLIVLGLLSLVDLAGPLFTDGQHPPMVIALIGAGLGLISIVLVILACCACCQLSRRCRRSSCLMCRPVR